MAISRSSSRIYQKKSILLTSNIEFVSIEMVLELGHVSKYINGSIKLNIKCWIGLDMEMSPKCSCIQNYEFVKVTTLQPIPIKTSSSQSFGPSLKASKLMHKENEGFNRE